MGPAFWLLVAGLRMGGGGDATPAGGLVCATATLTARVTATPTLTARVTATASIEEC